MTHSTPLWQLLESACLLRDAAVFEHGIHSSEWLRADVAVKKCQRALAESLRPSPSDDDPITLPKIPLQP